MVDADATFVGELREALVAAGLDMDPQADGTAAFQHLVSELFTYDMVAVTLEGTGQALVDQIRRLGGESDLRIAVLVDGDEGPHAWLKGHHAANDVINKWRPTPDVVKRLLKLLGR